MRRSVILLALILSVPAFAQPRSSRDRDRDRDRDDDQQYDGPPVVVPRGDLEKDLADIETALNDALAATKKKDRRLIATLTMAREALIEAKDTIHGAPELKFRRGDRRVDADLGERDWTIMRRYAQWHREWDDWQANATPQPMPPQPAPPYGQPGPYTPPGQPAGYPQPTQPAGYPQPTQPVPQYPPQPPQPTVYPIQDANLATLLASMNREGFPAARVRIVEQAAGSNYFLVKQVLQILGPLNFSADRLRVIQVLRPRILDMENAHQLYGAFKFQDEKDQLQVILK